MSHKYDAVYTVMEQFAAEHGYKIRPQDKINWKTASAVYDWKRLNESVGHMNRNEYIDFIAGSPTAMRTVVLRHDLQGLDMALDAILNGDDLLCRMFFEEGA